MNKKRIYLLALVGFTLVITGCSGVDVDSTTYPKEVEKVRREKRGKLTGEGGFKIFSGSDDGAGRGSGLGINSYLWRASLDTLSFVPLSSVDPRGGVIITDWYESPDAQGERFKINVVIIDTKLRSDGIRVSVFRQIMKSGVWRDAKINQKVSVELEDKILTRAREIKIGSTKR